MNERLKEEDSTGLDLPKAETLKQPLKKNPILEQDVLDVVSLHFNIDLPEIVGQSRNRSITYARHMAMYILKDSSGKSIADIGRSLGNRDHSTVIGAIKKIDLWLEVNDEITSNDYAQIMETLKEKNKANDPTKEPMNNFHCYMPGGIYRYDEKQPKNSLAEAMQIDFKKYEQIIDCDESTWPGADKKYIKQLKTKREVQREVDTFLNSNPKIAERWEGLKELFQNGGETTLKEFALRPVYIMLREKFTEEELSS